MGKTDIAVDLGVKAIELRRDALFFRLVTYRYGLGSILITTNSSVRDWSEVRPATGR